MKRVGHKGADAIAPGNTRASFDAAIAAGVDMIEFDVLPERIDVSGSSGGLFLAHDPGDLGRRRGEALTLEEGLDHLAGTGVELDVDLKLAGYEDRVVRALRERDLLGRTLISTMEPESLRALRAEHPDVTLGWSVPRLRRNPLRSPVTAGPAYAAMHWLRRVLPARASRAVLEGRCDALMCQWRLVTPALADALRAAGGALYVWTVDDAARIAELERLGVAGVITNDPRLFQPRTVQVAAE